MAVEIRRTRLGSLTTVFTPAPWCSEVVIVQCGSATCGGYQAQTCGSNTLNPQGIQDAQDCWPQRNTANLATPASLNGWGFYSPGIVCPAGMTSACSATFGVPSPLNQTWQFQFPLTESETAVGCCPVGYQCYPARLPDSTSTLQTCYKIATVGDTIPTAQCPGKGKRVSGILSIPFAVTVTTEVTPSTAGTGSAKPITTISTIPQSTMSLFAPMIQINWRASDRPTSSISTSSSRPRPTTSIVAPLGGESGLPTGATAGIAVSVVLVGIAIVGLGVWMFIKRRKGKRYLPAPPMPPDMDFAQGGAGPWDNKFAGAGGQQQEGGNQMFGDGSTVAGDETGAHRTGPMSEVSELPGSGGFAPSSASGTAYPSPESGYNNVRTSYFQMSPGGAAGPSRSCYDETRAELESPPQHMVHEMPGTVHETSANRAEMPGPVQESSANRAEMPGREQESSQNRAEMDG